MSERRDGWYKVREYDGGPWVVAERLDGKFYRPRLGWVSDSFFGIAHYISMPDEPTPAATPQIKRHFSDCPNCHSVSTGNAACDCPYWPEAATPAPGEVPACAAILTSRNVIIAGRRHHDCLASARDLFVSKQDIAAQGFMTTRGRFVDRAEAFQLRRAAGLPSAAKGGYRGDQLYSEDLY